MEKGMYATIEEIGALLYMTRYYKDSETGFTPSFEDLKKIYMKGLRPGTLYYKKDINNTISNYFYPYSPSPNLSGNYSAYGSKKCAINIYYVNEQEGYGDPYKF